MCGTALNRGEYITCGECDENFYRDVEKRKGKRKKKLLLYDSGSGPDYTMMCLYDEDTGNWSDALMLSEQDKLMEEHFLEDA